MTKSDEESKLDDLLRDSGALHRQSVREKMQSRSADNRRMLNAALAEAQDREDRVDFIASVISVFSAKDIGVFASGAACVIAFLLLFPGSGPVETPLVEPASEGLVPEQLSLAVEYDDLTEALGEELNQDQDREAVAYDLSTYGGSDLLGSSLFGFDVYAESLDFPQELETETEDENNEGEVDDEEESFAA